MKSTRIDIPPVIVTVESDVTIDVHDGGDFVVFRLEKGDKWQTRMQIYVGQSPPRLATLVKGELFEQEPVSFVYERASWFSWMASIGGERDKEFISVVYLYNIFRTQPVRDNPFIVQIRVSGSDFEAVQLFKNIASQLRFKGLKLLGEE